MRIGIFFLLLFLGSCKSSKEASVTVDTVKVVMDSFVIANELPGLNFSYITKDGQQKDYSAGVENITSKNTLLTSHSMFSGSVGKTYATGIILQLVDEGKIGLDEKIVKYLPKSTWWDRLANIDEITVRMLLSHTSGLPRWVMKPAVWSNLAENPDRVWSYKDRLEYIFDEEAVHEAGKDWAYSDTNYLILGYLIEAITGKDYYDVVQERILDRYDLKESYPSLKRDIKNLATGYSDLPESFQIPNEVVTDGKFVFNPQFEWTGGGMASTTADLARWAHVFFTSDMVSDNLKQEMFAVEETGKNVYKEVHSYGMGCFVYNTSYGTAYGHSGFMPGYNSIMAYFPDSGLTVAMQSNCDYSSKKKELTSYLETLIDAINK